MHYNRSRHLWHRRQFAGGVALTTLVIGHYVMTGGTERIAIAQLLLSFTDIGTMIALQVVWTITEHAAPVIASKDEQAEGSPIGTTVMRIVLGHSMLLT